MTTRALAFEITDDGLEAAFREDASGLGCVFSHIAIGTGLAQTSYAPTGIETTLRAEFARAAISSGERIGPAEIVLQALIDGPGDGAVREVGLFLSDGTLFGVWSGAPLGAKGPGVPFLFAATVKLEGIPLDRITIQTSGPTVNIMIVSPFALLSAELIRLQRRAIGQEANDVIAAINQTWY